MEYMYFYIHLDLRLSRLHFLLLAFLAFFAFFAFFAFLCLAFFAFLCLAFFAFLCLAFCAFLCLAFLAFRCLVCRAVLPASLGSRSQRSAPITKIVALLGSLLRPSRQPRLPQPA